MRLSGGANWMELLVKQDLTRFKSFLLVSKSLAVKVMVLKQNTQNKKNATCSCSDIAKGQGTCKIGLVITWFFPFTFNYYHWQG